MSDRDERERDDEPGTATTTQADPAGAEGAEGAAAPEAGDGTTGEAAEAGADGSDAAADGEAGGDEKGDDGADLGPDPFALIEAQIVALKAELTATQTELSQAQARTRASEEARARLQADFDNYRKRQTRELERLQDEKVEKMLLKLFPVFDGICRARAALDVSTDPAGVRAGLDGIQGLIDSFLAAAGITRIEAKGKTYDPARHEAGARVPIPEGMKDDDVVDVYEEGYMLRDRVIRTAKVTVAKVGA